MFKSIIFILSLFIIVGFSTRLHNTYSEVKDSASFLIKQEQPSTFFISQDSIRVWVIGPIVAKIDGVGVHKIVARARDQNGNLQHIGIIVDVDTSLCKQFPFKQLKF